ncbi:PREDICTED: cyclic phosphodiesterase-like isoform 2 [Fragaria vesca subsp. vesca]
MKIRTELLPILTVFGLFSFSLFILLQSFSSLMASTTPEKHVYSVWALPPEDVAPRLQKLMEGLRAEFTGPYFDPHITVVGAITLTPEDALNKFETASKAVKAYEAKVERVATGTFFYQCVFLLINPTPQVVEASTSCCGHFGYNNSTHLSDEDKKKAQEKANILDESITSLSFAVTRLALYKTDTEDKTLKSWEKIAECTLQPN